MQKILFLTFLLTSHSIFTNSQIHFGKFNLFVLNDSTGILSPDLGNLIGKADGTIIQYSDGKKVPAVFEVYDYDLDKEADLYIIRDNNSEILSIGIDTTSSSYKTIIKELKGKIIPQKDKNLYQESKSL